MKTVDLIRLKMVKEREVQYTSVSSPIAVEQIFRSVCDDLDKECFMVVHLNAKHFPNKVEIVAIGTLSATLVHPREVFKSAILSNSSAIVICHNHPSGNSTPSPEDLALTTQLLKAGEILGIKILDHIILGDTTHSLRENTNIWRDHEFHQ